jgi:hypothetical protein
LADYKKALEWAPTLRMSIEQQLEAMGMAKAL